MNHDQREGNLMRNQLGLRTDRHLSVAGLQTMIDSGDIDTVVVCFTDMQGRLQGKRMHANYFVDHVLADGTEGCNYLLAVDVEMNTVDGYAISSWQRGYGDMVFVLDTETLRLLPHQSGAAMVQCDLTWLDRTPVAESPRTILRRQLDRVASRGLRAVAGTELEFMVFDTGYTEALESDYRGLVPAVPYNADYSILAGSRIEPLLREIRNAMYGAGMNVESAKGECNLGQQEIGFRYADALTTADNHVVYKNAAKEIAAAQGRSITFMAKYDEREGNSCHIHLSLRGQDDSIAFWDDGRTPLYDAFIAGVLATMADFTLLYAPNINSYKRFADGSFAPTKIAWGEDNRTCAVRLVGHGSSARLENRVPGGDVNPYLALAAMIGGGLYGVEHDLPLPEPIAGNAYTAEVPEVPQTLASAREAFAGSAVAREVFGDAVVDHYTHMADTELTAFNASVTDWERRRCFERM
ncbi:glutamine synthetase family protein [Microlunatus soli]|uniref:Glutamine synthetase n=1 Tax=Microlunatus soli TaxID=630515 RepID=A0A1H1XAV3_9ACTN|nr:glutamine synthetase family protein [Microlunatus soli]SDT06322.1 glutamine synthetase [Microlunatus soli]